MRASDLMSTPVWTVGPAATVHEAAVMLCERDVTAVPVVSPTGRLLGIVSELDLLRGRCPHDPTAHMIPPREPAGDPPPTVADVMTRDVVVATPATDTGELAELMARTGVKSVPVVDGEVVVGIVSRRDLLRVLTRADEDVRRDVTERLRAYARDTAAVTVQVCEGVVDIRGPEDVVADRAVAALAYGVPGVVRVHVHAG